ncbi:MAG: ribosome biogenesis GTP-binding protein YihA/YsxC [Saprospiraceae bacterium]
MIIHTVEFTGSFPEQRLAPQDGRIEFAFIGRSNVGKSSLVNMVMDRKDLARISNVPGKTQHLNYYLVNDAWYLVDLPGYGYARVSKQLRRQWRLMMEHYFKNRETLACVFVLLDSNIPPQKVDIEFMNWMGELGLPFVMVYTKADRVKPAELENNQRDIQQAVLAHWEELPMEVITSAVKNTGRDEILDIIAAAIEQV